ncbi:hypothetical protein HDU67_004054 [Dinochytrium kinnereticum]|nr:hypothetical protein HDU67_004054 [Dinochytrium kinnereticum]
MNPHHPIIQVSLLEAPNPQLREALPKNEGSKKPLKVNPPPSAPSTLKPKSVQKRRRPYHASSTVDPVSSYLTSFDRFKPTDQGRLNPKVPTAHHQQTSSYWTIQKEPIDDAIDNALKDGDFELATHLSDAYSRATAKAKLEEDAHVMRLGRIQQKKTDRKTAEIRRRNLERNKEIIKSVI